MLARELAEPYPVVDLDSDAFAAARLMAERRLPGLIVNGDDGRPWTILPGSQVLRFVVPGYVQDDPALARVYDETARRPSVSTLGEAQRAGTTSQEAARTRHPQRTRHRHRGGRPDGTTAQPARRRARWQRAHRRNNRLSIAEHAAAQRAMSAAAIVIFVVAYILIATERVHRVAAALGGAAAMALLGIVNAETAFFSEESGIDWNVIFLLLGMMIIVSVINRRACSSSSPSGPLSVPVDSPSASWCCLSSSPRSRRRCSTT